MGFTDDDGDGEFGDRTEGFAKWFQRKNHVDGDYAAAEHAVRRFQET